MWGPYILGKQLRQRLALVNGRLGGNDNWQGTATLNENLFSKVN